MRRVAIILFITGLILIVIGILLENPNCSQSTVNLTDSPTVDEVYQQLQTNITPYNLSNGVSDTSATTLPPDTNYTPTTQIYDQPPTNYQSDEYQFTGEDDLLSHEDISTPQDTNYDEASNEIAFTNILLSWRGGTN